MLSVIYWILGIFGALALIGALMVFKFILYGIGLLAAVIIVAAFIVAALKEHHEGKKPPE